MATRKKRSEPARTLRVRLVKSTIGSPADQRATVRSLGLRRLHASVVVVDTPVTRGMLRAVDHLVRIEEGQEIR